MSTPPRSGPATWTARGVFRLDLVYVVVLVVVLVLRAVPWRFNPIIAIPDPIGGVVPVGVPWFGALGAVLISLYGVFDHNTEWEPRLNYWHIARPVVGATLAVVAFMIFVGLINAAGGDPAPAAGPASGADRSNVGYLVLAFVVGFREETFRTLLKRAVDLLLGPGIPGQTTAVVLVTVEAADPGAPTVTGTATWSVTVANAGTAEVSLSTLIPVVAPATAATAGFEPGFAPVVLLAGTSRRFPLTLTATGSGDATLVVTAGGSFGTRSTSSVPLKAVKRP